MYIYIYNIHIMSITQLLLSGGSIQGRESETHNCNAPGLFRAHEARLSQDR